MQERVCRIFGLWKKIGIHDNPYESDDSRAQKLFDDSVQFIDGRYQVGFPWKEYPPTLASNFQLASGRLCSTIKRLAQDKNLLEKYDGVIKQQLDRGIIEKVTKSEKDGQVIHYIPHHPIITPNKSTTKLRIVYDASARTNKSAASLNECMLRGPVILEDLCGILLRFRMHHIALVADIEKAFLQVSLCKRDREGDQVFVAERHL